jgi:glycosyltransferase involved in cell wall biosynthesis
MRGLRVVLVTRRFWPLVGGAENTMAALAMELRARGAEPTVLTAQGTPDWPSCVHYDGIRVTRLPGPRSDVWGTFRYLQALRSWLRWHKNQIDVVCVSRLRLEAYAALTALRRTAIPVVLRAEQSGEAGDLPWLQRRGFGSRILKRCRTAAAVIAPDASVVAELVQAGFARSQIHMIANGIPPMPARSYGDRGRAREALAEINPDLQTREATRVVLFVGRLRQSNGLLTLISAWPAVLQAQPEARLWVIGDGPLRDPLCERVMDLQLQSKVLLPGTFEDVGDLYAAADVFVCPTRQAGVPLALLEAAAARVPIVASDMAEIRCCGATAGDNAILVPVDDRAALQRALIRQLEHPPARHALFAAARSVARDFSCQGMAEAHVRLFQRLLGGPSPKQR